MKKTGKRLDIENDNRYYYTEIIEIFIRGLAQIVANLKKLQGKLK